MQMGAAVQGLTRSEELDVLCARIQMWHEVAADARHDHLIVAALVADARANELCTAVQFLDNLGPLTEGDGRPEARPPGAADD
jgi:hypothetical protein